MVETRTSEAESKLVVEIEGFLRKVYFKKLIEAANSDKALIVDFKEMDEYSPDLADTLLNNPDKFYEILEKAQDQIDVPKKVKIRFQSIPSSVNIRDLRSKHLNKFVAVEGTVRKASEIRPEITETVWECSQCGNLTNHQVKGGFVLKPFQCQGDISGRKCSSRFFKQVDKRMVDTRWIVIEEPFESTEGDRPSQVTILLSQDLVSPEGRRLTDPGNRLKITGVLKDIPKSKSYMAKLDFYLEANYAEPTDVGWEKLEMTKEDEQEIKRLAATNDIYRILVDSLAPSIYGMDEIKESIILQIFGGVQRELKDGIKFRGNIHILLVGDPSAGKSQILKVVSSIVPRGKYVSGKGVSGAGLTATVTKDEQFMGGWVLEAGALVLANKGLISIDEFEKMDVQDMVAMHEALEQGSISIAKASIVATLPAQTSVLAGGNPKFSRFDPYLPISKQITIPDTLLSRFDLKFILKDIPHEEQDEKIADHVLRSREEDYEKSKPRLETNFIKKYVAYCKEHCKPNLTKEAGRALRKFYVSTRKKAEGGSAPIPITLRQFEALIRLSEASAKIQLSDIVRKEDVDRAITLMKHSLRQLGMDPDTGLIDVDRSEGGTTSSERSHIRVVLDIINTLAEKHKEIPVSMIEEQAKKQGVTDASDIVDKLKREGMLFEPNPGYVQKV